MSIALASLSVTAGTSYTYNVGSRATVGAVVVLNESPYGLNVSNGASSQWIAAQTADLVPCDSMGFNGNLTITTDSYLDNASSAPSFLVYFTAYAPGEAIRGIYPTALSRLTSGNLTVGNNAAVTVERDLLTPFVLTGFVASIDGSVANQLDVTSGIAYPQQSDGSLLRQAPAAATFRTSTPSATYFLDLNPDGSWSWGTSHSTQSNYLTIAQATTNGSGNISAVTDERPLNTTLLNQMAGNLTFNQVTFITATRGGGSVLNVNGAMTVGTVNSTAPITLSAGNQETGYLGGGYAATANGQNYLFVTNFKTVMSNVPTSITTASDGLNLVSSVSTGSLNKYGFWLQITSSGAGYVFWHGTYTTVGNCLLGLDSAARTFDHHCDTCGAVVRAIPVQATQYTQSELGAMLAYTCATCGAQEHFNTQLTSADEADTTPQGSGEYATTRGAQATLIRQLMTALGMEVAA